MKLYKDKAGINYRNKAAQIDNLNELVKIVEETSSNSEERKVALWLDSLEPNSQKHNPVHKKCGYKIGVDSEEPNEKRICRCMYYFNNGNAEQETVCETCNIGWKSRKNISDYKILDHEVPMPTVSKGVGGIDLVLQDLNNPGDIYATEVKPEDSDESIPRMIAEILTYCEMTGYQIVNDGETIPVKPAICFFKGSKQYQDFFNMDDMPAIHKLLKEIKVFYIECNGDSFTIHDNITKKSFINVENLEENFKKGTPSQRFDAIIKENLIHSKNSEDKWDSFGYYINDRTYESYYKKEIFDGFIEEMKIEYPEHYRKYAGDEEAKENKGGAGGELAVKKGSYGFIPPKMASVASSSRFCYLALKDGTDALDKGRAFTKDDVEFEKECKIFDTGHAPQLDAYIPGDDMNIYVEVKCHEIFDEHTPTFKNKYWKYFRDDNVFNSVALEEDEHKETFTISLDNFGIEGNVTRTRFDIKQLVCHLLGIARQNKGEKAKLVYLFFKPLTEEEGKQEFVNKVFSELENEINMIFKKGLIPEFCKMNNIELEAIAQESDIMCKLESRNVINLLKD